MSACATCGTENPDGARFCLSCGSSLIPACPVCGAERSEGARFCPSCGTRLDEETPPPSGHERRIVTVLFADVAGSTSLGERHDPEHLQEILATYFAAMREEIEAEGGTVEKFIGDAIMAAFGVPFAHEDDPARALRTALRMRRRLGQVNEALRDRWGVNLEIRTGVNTGEVLAASDPPPGEPMVTGDAVNVAARLEQLAEPGQVVVAERTARAARGFRFADLGALEVRGKGDAVPAVLLEGPAADTPERGVPGLQAPMVGRDQELALLQSLYGRSVAERRPSLVTIYGDPGVGKSRLVREFVTWARSQTQMPLVTFGRCLPYGDGVTYWPLAEILKRYAGVHDDDPSEVVLEKIRSSSDGVLSADPSIDAARASRALAYTVGLEFPDMPMGDREPRQVRGEMHVAWRSFFSALSRSAPVVVVVEDIHWADDPLLDLLDELADKVLGPAMFICPARPELLTRRASWGGGRRNFSSVTLEPLSDDDSDRLVRLLLTIDDLPPAVHRRILERAEGNPFFLEEIVRHLIDERTIVREGERWRAVARIGDVEIPDTVQGVLAARIDLLGSDEKRALQRAAVVGRVFWPGPVKRLLNGDGEKIASTLGRLEERDLVLSRLGSSFTGESEFAFKHILTREVAYETLPRRERAQAHALVAAWIEEIAGERVAEFVELLAYHYVEAHRGAIDEPSPRADEIERLRARAFEAVLGAGDVARSRFATERALRLSRQAQALAGTPRERARALERLGITAMNDYRGDLAHRSLREAADLLIEHEPEDHATIARLCALAIEPPTRWPGSMREGVAEEDISRYLEIGLSHVDETGDSEELVRLLIGRAFGPFSVSLDRRPSEEEVATSMAAGERAADIAMRLGRPDLASAALDGASSTLIILGRYGQDHRYTERRIDLAPSIDDPWELGDIFAMAAWLNAYAGEYRRAFEFGHEGSFRAADEAEGIRIHNLCWSAFAAFHLGEWDAIVEDLHPRVVGLLGERADNPPYFAAHAFGAAAAVFAVRDDARAETFLDLLERVGGVEDNRSIAFLGWASWIRALAGDAAAAVRIVRRIDEIPSAVHRPHSDVTRVRVMRELPWLDDADAFLSRTRPWATEGALAGVLPHLDALEGDLALERSDVDRAIERFSAARQAFDTVHAQWDAARCDLSLAEALAGQSPDQARERVHVASAIFERLRSRRELERAAAVRERLA